jgi:hypothetical protein
MKQPADDDFKNQQIDLFQSFLCNTEEQRNKLSNTIDLWDYIPKYSISQVAQNKIRTEEGLLPQISTKFIYQGKEYKMFISAAQLSDEDGKAYYPSANEELVEDALRKIATEQLNGFYDTSMGNMGVTFSLYQLRNELNKTGHTRSFQQIVKSLLILSGSEIEILPENKSGRIKSNFLSSLVMSSKRGSTDDPNSRWVVHFHPLVSKSLNSIEYRQFNYQQMMSLKTHLGRWLHKKITHYYTNASLTTHIELSFATIRQESKMLERSRVNDAIKELESIFDELISEKIFICVSRKKELRGARNKIIDIIYSASPHPDFVKSVKAANKRQTDSKRLTNQNYKIIQ